MSSAMRPATRRVPTLDELRELTAEPDERVVFRGVDWDFYERMADAIPEGANLHVDFDGRDLEVMAKGRKHEAIRERLGYLVRLVTEELEIDHRSLGETTWKRPTLARGLEADQSYYFLPAKIAEDDDARARGSEDIADYPDPDLAVEVDISSPQVDRAGIYSSMVVAEVWRFVEDGVVVERLGPDGAYHRAESSGFLPITAEEIRRWVVEEDARVEWAWARRLREWARAELRPRLGREQP